MTASILSFALLFASIPATAAEPSPSSSPRIVTVPSGPLKLKALLWTPAGPGPFPAVLFTHGSGSADPAHTGRLAIVSAAEELGPVFVKHGYMFLYLFRRGQGLSAGQGPFLQDLLRRERAAKGEEARRRLQLSLLTKDHLDDVVAGLSFLRSLPAADARRIAVAGHSFGGQLALLAAERDGALRAAVGFGAAAGSWERWPALRERLLVAVRKTTVPLMLVYAANDYSLDAGKALAGELARRGRPHALKIYPPLGSTSDEGHMAVYTAVARWEADVFAFLDEHVGR